MSIESVMLSNHIILCAPLLFLSSIICSIRVFSNESALPIRWPKYQSFNFSISPANEYSELIPLGLTGLISLQTKRLSRVFSTTTIWKHQFFHRKSIQSFLWSSSHSHTWLLEITLTIQPFVSKVMSLLFNTLSRLVRAFLPRSKCFLISRLQSLSAVILEPKKIKSINASTSTLDCDRESIHYVEICKRKNQIFILYFSYKIALLVTGYIDSIVIKDIPTNKWKIHFWIRISLFFNTQ